MKKKTVFELHMDEILPLNIYHFGDDAMGPSTEIDYNNYEELAKDVSNSEDLLYTLLSFAGDINTVLNGLRQDVIDLYEKMEE